MKQWSFGINQIASVAAEFLKAHEGKTVYAFHGQMGAGKTTFIHALCDSLRVSSTVGSPTFSLINEYAYPGGTIYHIDLYRLNTEEDAIRAGVEDCLYSGHLCFLEWPERAPTLIPADAVQVYMETTGPQSRIIKSGDK